MYLIRVDDETMGFVRQLLEAPIGVSLATVEVAHKFKDAVRDAKREMPLDSAPPLAQLGATASNGAARK